MTVREALKKTERIFAKLKLADSALEAAILLAAVLKKNKEYLYAHPDDRMSIWQCFLWQRMIALRRRGYSSAVLVGHKWFYGLDFLVNRQVLIPRPETELMVDEAIKIIESEKLKFINLLDVGTGSGCVAISIAKNLKNKEIKFLGLDISQAVLRLARQNAKRNGVGERIHFLYGDLLNTIDKKIFNEPLFITANLPYLTAEQIKKSPTIQKEPLKALLSGKDGLDHYRRLFAEIRKLRRSASHELAMLCEIDETQKDVMTQLIRENFPNSHYDFFLDHGGADRLVKIEL